MNGKLIKVLLLPIFLTILPSNAEDSGCRWKEYSFKSLENFPWNVVVRNGSSRTEYQISLCRPLNSSVPECSLNTSICQLSSARNASLGVYNTSLQVTEDGAKRELTLTLESQNDCPHGSDKRKMKTFIIFRCGKTLGMPVFVNSYACDTYFDWHTTAACRPAPNISEVRCYQYDTNGQLRDLSPLVKTIGAHLVDTDDDDEDGELHINICRDISQPSQASQCRNSAAYLLRNSSCIPLGSIQSDTALQFDSDGSLSIAYKSATTPAGCSAPPSVQITLRCPQRGMGDTPQLISSLECQYHVEWASEYACPATDLTSHTCQLSHPSIDLRSLATARDNAFSVPVEESGNLKYTYSFNLCSLNSTVGEGVECGGRTVAACQFDDLGQSAKSLGLLEKQTLRYSDNELSLTYEGGDPCSSGFQRKTIFQFHCNESAGKGYPEFSGENSCTYLFNWNTNLACVAPPLLCQLSDKKAKYDLSGLVTPSNWQTIDSETSETIILNVCRNVVTNNTKAVNCPADAAICLIKNSAKAVSLGKFLISPIFDSETQSIRLMYKDGDVCGNSGSKYSANVTFKCSSGSKGNGPRLLRKSSDGCHYELIWFTAFACSLAHASGDNCRVEDPLAGYVFDLNPLSKPNSGTNSYYNVTNELSEHDYFLNVCGPVTGTACSGDNVGMCQVERRPEKKYHNTGQPNRTLHYYNGVLKLVYSDGDAYHSDPPVGRKTEIAFLCDVEAGIGWPRFVSEANRTYFVEWVTSYACPPMFVDCSFVDLKANKRYDLSPLSRKDADGNWVVDVSTSLGSGRKMYINVCRPLIAHSVSGSDPCAAVAGVCLTEYSGDQEKVIVANFGRSLAGPRIASDGKIILEYTSGEICTKNNEATHYTTRIVFICNKDATTGSPSSNEFNPGCNQTLIWETAFACPKDVSEVASAEEDCSIRDPITGHLYDLSPLRSNKSYTVNNTGRVFRLNICGRASECGNNSVTVCDDKGQNFGYSLNSSLHFKGGLVELQYYGPETGSGKRKVLLMFTCNELFPQSSPRITFIEEEVTVLAFSVETPLVCLSYAVNCQTFDGMGNKYDLSPLMKLDGNWVVEDPKRNRYHINVCRPINKVNSTQCSGGAVGGCQVTSTGDIFNMGYVQGHLIATERGTVTLQYQDGDVCHKGTEKESRRSTRIIFYCSTRRELPIFQREEDDCSYVFHWQTPSACPIQDVVGEYCVVQEPLYQISFDLNELTKTGDDDYVVYGDGGRNFTLNVCGALRSHKSDACAVGAGACIGQGVDAVNIGNYSSRLEYEDGELKLFYTDGKENCNGKWNRTTTIMFSCDHEREGTSGLSYVDELSSDCSHWFEWQTSAACLPFSEAECHIADVKGNTYDFDRLTMSGDNYEVEGIDAPGGPAKFIINVCTTLVHTKGALCPPNSAACMMKVNETDPKKRYVSIGQLDKNVLSFDKDHIVLSYSGGVACSDGRKSKTVIQFECAPDALDSKPVYVSTDSGCVHRFVWSTRAACVLNTTVASPGDCSVQDPYTGHVYNLSALRNDLEPYVVSGSKFDHSYNLSVCGPLHESPCGPNSGSCQGEKNGQNRTFDAGQSNSFLVYENSGLLKLIYSNGSMCHHTTPRSTTITFICANGAGKGKPEFVGEDPHGCGYFFSWHTELACDREIRCVAHSDEHEQDFDLSSLNMENTMYTAPGSATGLSSGVFYINVCRPLGAIYGKFFPPGAAVCQEESNGNLTSLGSLTTAPTYDPVAKSVVLVYSNGSVCPSKSSLQWKTKINFLCRPGQPENSPKLIGVDENLCEYNFEWVTSAVCPSAPSFKVTNATGCTFKDASQHQFNFSSLMSTTEIVQVPSTHFTGQKYNVSLCGSFQSGVCASSAVCRVDGTSQVTSYGSAQSLSAIFEWPNVKLSYRYGVNCQNGFTSAIFMMECDRSASRESKPVISHDDECFVMFKWPTPLACVPKEKPCRFLYDTERMVDLSRFSRKTNSWKLNDPYGNSYFLNLCHGINDGPSGCGNDMAVCQKGRDGSLRQLGTVDSQSHATSSGPEKSLIIEYSHHAGATSCVARIEVVCAAENEEPRFKQSVDDCIVEFEWKLNLICGANANSVPTSSTSSLEMGGSKASPNGISDSESPGTGNSVSSTVVIMVSILALASLILILFLVFRNPSRRASFAGKMRSLFGKKRSFSSMQYTALSDRDLTEGDGLLSRSSGNIQHYDSDDDLML